VRFSSLPLALSFLLVLACSSTRQETSPIHDSASRSPECGPGLSEAQVWEIVKKALVAKSGDASLEGMSSRIFEDGCDYVFTAHFEGLAAIDGFGIVIDRAGRIKSFPACCYLDHCPDLCSAPEPKEQ
jgi:hypothetical protein